MGMVTQTLKGITKPNTIADSGGLSSLLVPRKFNAGGAALVIGGVGAFNLANEGIKSRNRSMLGRVTYADGLARMTNSYTTGVVPAMKRASGGNYAVFADMAEEVVTHNSMASSIENYGATPELVSALYHMGGR